MRRLRFDSEPWLGWLPPISTNVKNKKEKSKRKSHTYLMLIDTGEDDGILIIIIWEHKWIDGDSFITNHYYGKGGSWIINTP